LLEMPLTRSQLLVSATSLCNAFASNAPLSEILSHFSTTYAVSAQEHGLPLLAPFIGRTFTGITGPKSVSTYFQLLQRHINFQDMSFGAWTIDVESRKISCIGKAKFRWVEGPGDGQSWDETFVYHLDFDGEGKVTDYQVWADTGAAYLARTAQLEQRMKEFEKDTANQSI